VSLAQGSKADRHSFFHHHRHHRRSLPGTWAFQGCFTCVVPNVSRSLGSFCNTVIQSGLAPSRVSMWSMRRATPSSRAWPHATRLASSMQALNTGTSEFPNLFVRLLTQFSCCSKECFCGNSLQNGGTPAPLPDCSSSCPGNAAEKCGAGSRLSLYSKGGTPPKPPAPDVAAWQYEGCWRYDNSSRLFHV
jgi:hypothetical protein